MRISNIIKILNEYPLIKTIDFSLLSPEKISGWKELDGNRWTISGNGQLLISTKFGKNWEISPFRNLKVTEQNIYFGGF